MPAPRNRGNAQRRSFTTIFSNEQRYLSLTGLSRDIADASLGTQSNVFERCVTSSLLPSRAAERYAAMLYARDEPLGVLECIEALARELSITADEPASEEGLVGFVRYAYDFAIRHRVEIGPCAARRTLAADLEALVDHLSQREERGGPEAADRLLTLISELSGDNEFLRKNWGQVKKVLSYAWEPKSWDGNQDGVMEGSQHNTMDARWRWEAYRRRPLRQMGVHLRSRENQADPRGSGSPSRGIGIPVNRISESIQWLLSKQQQVSWSMYMPYGNLYMDHTLAAAKARTSIESPHRRRTAP